MTETLFTATGEEIKNEIVKIDEVNIKKLVSFTLPKIEYDFTLLEKAVDYLEKKYDRYVVQQDTLKADKKLLAEINGVATDINKQRIAISNQIKEPEKELKSAVDTQLKRINALAETLKTQIKEYEEAEANEKTKEILALENYDEKYGFDKRWLNKSYSMAQIKKDITELKKAYRTARSVITTMCFDKLDPNDYYNMLDKGTPIDEISETIKRDIEIKEKYIQTGPATDKVPTPPIVNSSGIKYRRTLKINATKEQMIALKDFLDTNQIEYEVE